MNSAPHLLTEDRPDFERVLDEALRTTEAHPGPHPASQRPTTPQLRTMALSAITAISACAAVEYERYVQARDALRTSSAPVRPGGERGEADGEAVSLPGVVGDVAGGSGAGLVAVLAVLAPVLAGAAAVIFLLVGYVLRVFAPDASVSGPLVTAGWVFAACAAIGVLLAAAGLLIIAVRNGGGRRSRARVAEVDQARAEWHQALLEQGMVPFLREALAHGETAAPGRVRPAESPPPHADLRTTHSGSAGRTPHLGYSRPGFTSPGDGGADTAPGPRYSSPDFTGPELGGQDHRSP
ncbi:hypothetical protein [Streptomyces sp. NPDC057702]|uniref:hypothetical protein n=1 Tax=unclassified Streptomyces TaxID=2593676 RepID=UPI0036B0336B